MDSAARGRDRTIFGAWGLASGPAPCSGTVVSVAGSATQGRVLYDKSWPIRTRVRQYPPAKFVFGEPGRTGMAMNSIITAGVIISGGLVSNSVLSQDVRVNSYSEIDSSIIFSHVSVGRHCRIRRAIIDRDVHIPEGTVIGYDPVEDKRRYFVTPSGLTIVTRDASLFENPVEPEFGDRY